MSVTFSTPAPVTAWAFSCGHENGTTAHRFATWEEARGLLAAELESHQGTGHLAVCGDDFCRTGRMLTHAITDNPGPSMRVSNVNAVHLLGVLGLEAPDDCDGISGSLPAGELLAAVAGAELAPGYMTDRVAGLRAIGEFAAYTGRPVQWA